MRRAARSHRSVRSITTRWCSQSAVSPTILVLPASRSTRSRWRHPARRSAFIVGLSTALAETVLAEQLQVAIIGAGATGVELAAELHNTTRELVAYGLD